MNELTPEEIPHLMYGTAWKEEETAPLTMMAITQGFRAIDTANQRKHYFEAGVGHALSHAYEEGIVTRDELFLQSKFTYVAGQDHRLPYDPDAPYALQVAQSFDSSLQHLGTDFLDSYVLHGPSQRSGLSRADFEVWSAMEALFAEGKTRALGISNVTAEQLRELLASADVAPLFVQNRCFARAGWDLDVRKICGDNDIIYQGFSLLTANRSELQHPDIRAIALRHERHIPQIIFRFAIDVGMLPLTGTTDPEHMRQDLDILDFRLSDEEVATIEEIAI